MRSGIILAVGFMLTLSACANKSPEEIRQETAAATAKVKTDTKAVAQGIKEGLHRGDVVDLNTAPKEKLLALPGITEAAAERIIKGRPYDDPQELTSRHILSQAQYDQIKGQVEVKK